MRVALPVAVRWFYRVLIQDPPDLPATIAAETGFSVSDVTDAIAETRAVFNLTPDQQTALRCRFAGRTPSPRRARRREHHGGAA